MLAGNSTNTSGREFINKTPCAKSVISGHVFVQERKREVWRETLKKHPEVPPYETVRWRREFFHLYPKQWQSLVQIFVLFHLGHLIFMMDDVMKFKTKRKMWLLDCNYCSFDRDLIHEVAAQFHAETQEYWAKSSKTWNRVQPTVIKLSKSGRWKCRGKKWSKQLKPISYLVY